MKTVLLLFILIYPGLIKAQSTEKIVIHFDFDKYELRADAKAVLDSFIILDKASTSDRTIELHGHCDYKGNDEYNDRLSLQRLLAVKSYLEKNDLTNPAFTVQQPHGKRIQLNNSNTSEEQMLNRRVEIIVTWKEKAPPVTKKTEPVAQSLSLEQQLEDTATAPGSNIIIDDLHFIGGSHRLLNSSYPVLQTLLKVLKRNPKLEIEIEGHICCLPNNDDGFDYDTGTANLSEERAKAIYTYLINNNISASRLSHKGYGHQRPIFSYPEKNEQERIQNRRVEIKIIRK